MVAIHRDDSVDDGPNAHRYGAVWGVIHDALPVDLGLAHQGISREDAEHLRVQALSEPLQRRQVGLVVLQIQHQPGEDDAVLSELSHR